MERTVKSQTDIQRIYAKDSRDQRPIFLILGAGYSARALIPTLIAQGFLVITTSRSKESFPPLIKMGATPLIYDTQITQSLLDALSRATHILCSTPPTGKGDPFIQAVKEARPMISVSDLAPHIEWAGYLSATSVYGNKKGHWAFENELLKPVTQRGKNRALAELNWLESGLPIHIFRLAGIYGPGRNPFQKLKSGTARAVIKDAHIVNRIHVDDIARAISASLQYPDPVSLYNLADDCPAPPQDVLDFAADLIGTPPAKRVLVDSADVSDMARSFYDETKRISNQYAKDKLHWHPLYPNYKMGLKSVLQTELGTPDTVIVSGYIDIPKEDLKAIKLALPTHIRLLHQEKDCIFFHIRQDTLIPTRFHISERFENKAGYRRHQDRLKNSEWAHITRSATHHYECWGL